MNDMSWGRLIEVQVEYYGATVGICRLANLRRRTDHFAVKLFDPCSGEEVRAALVAAGFTVEQGPSSSILLARPA